MIDVPYRWQYILAVLCAVVLAGLGVATSQAATLGLTQAQLGMIAVGTSMIGVLAAVLPNIRKPPNPDREGLD